MKQIDDTFKAQIEAYINDNFDSNNHSLFIWDKITAEWDLTEYNNEEVFLCYYQLLSKKYN
jgi:hypothetical protein